MFNKIHYKDLNAKAKEMYYQLKSIICLAQNYATKLHLNYLYYNYKTKCNKVAKKEK